MGSRDVQAPAVGLCGACRHARVQRSARGSEFWRCLAAERPDAPAGMQRYPALPVRACPAHEPGHPGPATGS